MKNYILMQYFIQNILNGANYYNGVINVKFSNEEIINANASSLIKCVASYFNLDNFYPKVKDLKLDKALYDSLRNDLGIKEKSITFEVGSYEYENISFCLNFDIYDISYYKRVLNLLKKMLNNFDK